MQNGKHGKFYQRHFIAESLAAFVAEASSCMKYREGDDEWMYGSEFKNREETIKALSDGVSPALARTACERTRGQIESGMNPSDFEGLSSRRKRAWMDSGDPDTDRVLDRRENWASESQRGRRSRLIRIGINVWLSAGNDEASFGDLVGTACAIADTVTRLGHATEIVGMMAGTVRLGGTGFVYVFPLKSAGEPLDVELVGSIGAPGLMRDLGFSIAERDMPNKNWCSACEVRSEELKSLVGIDYLITQSWFGMSQFQVFEGIKSILGQE